MPIIRMRGLHFGATEKNCRGSHVKCASNLSGLGRQSVGSLEISFIDSYEYFRANFQPRPEPISCFF